MERSGLGGNSEMVLQSQEQVLEETLYNTNEHQLNTAWLQGKMHQVGLLQQPDLREFRAFCNLKCRRDTTFSR